MGLDTSHGAWHGAYSAFNRFRQIVAKAAGGSFPPHENPEGLKPDYWYAGDDYSRESHPGLFEFLAHSDCDGEISPEMCAKVAEDLEALLPAIERLDHGGGGHIDRDGGYVAVTRRFIAGCRAAHAAGERLEFR